MTALTKRRTIIVDILTLAAVDQDEWSNSFDLRLEELFALSGLLLPEDGLKDVLTHPQLILDLDIDDAEFCRAAMALASVSEGWTDQHDALVTGMLFKLGEKAADVIDQKVA